MKKALLTLTIVLAASVETLKAQNVNIPDANFKACLVGNTLINTNSDSEIQVSEAEAFTGSINCNSSNISDLTGIEAFVNLTSLYVFDNNLTTINVSANTELTLLSCPKNQLTSLDVSSNVKLENLNCTNNPIPSINLSSNTLLEAISIQVTQITSLDLSAHLLLHSVFCSFNPNLELLNVKNGNNINFIDFYASDCPELSCIEVDDAIFSTNNWTNIDVTTSFSENCDETTSIINLNATENTIHVYPNPTKNQINFSDQTNVQVTNMTGQIIVDFKNVNTLDFSDQTAGIYFLILTDNHGQEIQRSKIVKE